MHIRTAETPRAASARWTILAFLFLAYGSVNGALLAQANDIGATCRPALMKDYISTIQSSQQKISWFQSIDQRTFEEIKHNAGFRIGIPIPLVGDLIGVIDASANYDDFKQRRSEYLKREGYVSDMAREERDLRIVTSPIAYSAWSQCIETMARQSKTVYAFKDQEDSETVHIRIVNATPTAIKLHSDLLNGNVPRQKAGKAFKDGKGIDGGGALAVLVRRAGKGKMKLSLTSDPMYDIPVIESEWGAAPKEQLRGTLRVTLGAPDPQDRGNVLGESWTWPDMHSRGCDGGGDVCTSDRKWKATQHALTVRVSDAKFQLSSVWLECVAGSWEWNAGNPWSCNVHSPPASGSCTKIAAAGATTYRIWGKQIEIQSRAVEQPVTPVLVFGVGQQFILTVPEGARSAVFEYKTEQGDGTLKPGDPASPDGQIVLLGSSPLGDRTTYTYKYR